MRELEPHKRYALATALIKLQVARRRDDLGDILVKRMQNIHNKGRLALQEYRAKHQSETDYLINKLHNVLVALRDAEGPKRLETVETAAGADTLRSIERCEEHAAFADDNYSPFLWQFHKGQRAVLFRLLENIELASTSTDKGTEALVQFIIQHRNSKVARVGVEDLDLDWVSGKWWKTLCTKEFPSRDSVDRRHFEFACSRILCTSLKAAIFAFGAVTDIQTTLSNWFLGRSSKPPQPHTASRLA
jgi:hypothetical protein